MTPQEIKELNERMLKKIGFKYITMKSDVKMWYEPGANHYSIVQTPDDNGSLPDLLHDPAACFKWLVPELRKQGCEVVSFFYNMKNIDCDLTPANHATATIEASADTESLALCLAADKFLKE